MIVQNGLAWVTIVFYNSWLIVSGQSGDGCRETEFLRCVIPLKIQRVPFDQNILNVVFNITTDSKLQQTCRAYTDVLPCFRDKILRCGNPKQVRMMNEVKKMLSYFCSPSSTATQKEFLRHSDCLSKVMMSPMNTNCFYETHPLAKKLSLCRQHCEKSKEFICMMEVWVSEQSLCTIVDINNQCGPQAADFYTDLQVNVFTPEYPVVCKAPGYNPDSTEGSTLNGNSVLEQTAPPMIASTLPTTTVSYIIFSNFIFETTTTSKNYLETLMDEPFISLPPTFNASTTLPPSKPTVTSGSRPYSSLVGTVKLTSDRNTIGVRVEKGKNKEDLKYRSDGCQVNQYLLLVIITVISSLWSTK